MAREATITKEQVHAVADALVAAGVKPTARSIRERLGRGSMATVLRMFQQWQAGSPPMTKSTNLPPEIALILSRHIESEVGMARAELEERVAERDVAIADLIAECESGRDELTEAENERDMALLEKAKVEGELARMREQIESLAEEARRHLRDAEAARTELAKANLRLEAMPRLESMAEELTRRAESMRVRAETAERCSAVLEAKLEAERDAHERARKDADDRKTESAGLVATIGAGKRMTARRRERQQHW